MKKDNVFTVIVTYNGMKWIEECISSVYNDSTVIVVDNVSKDKTVSLIKEKFPAVVLLQQEENLGFGIGNNVGIDYALNNGAAHVLLLNQDAKMSKKSLDVMVSFQKRHSEYGILSPIHCDWNGEYLERSFSRYVGYEFNPLFYSNFILDKKKQDVYEVPFIAAACWLINRETFETVGGFDPMFFYLGEDTNYCQRVLFHDYKIAVMPDTFVNHDTKDRKYEETFFYSEKYFYQSDYAAKKKYGDVSLETFESKFKYKKRQLFKAFLFQCMIGNFKLAKGAFSEYKKFTALKETLIKSRAKNKTKGSHYLNLI